jgi:phosphonoacetate hydrolase
MNSKQHLINLQAILNKNGFDVFCHSPYHWKPSDQDSKDASIPANQCGLRFLYLRGEQKQKEEELVQFLEKSSFVDLVSSREEAAKRYNLPADLIGDYLIFAAEGYAFADFDGEEQELESARSNGSLYERAVPLIAVNAAEVPEKYRYSRDIVKIIMESSERS